MIKQILTHKVSLLIILTLLMLLPVQSVLELNHERQSYRTEAIQSMMRSASGQQQLIGPIIVQPYTHIYWKETENKTTREEETVYEYILPEKLNVQGNLQVTPRQLGIYKAQVYKTRLSFTGSFPTQRAVKSSEQLIPQTAYLTFLLSDARGINSVPELQLGEELIAFAPGSNMNNKAGIHAPLNSSNLSNGNFKIELDLQGMESLAIAPVGRDTQYHLQGNWPHPNFIGDFLPTQHTSEQNGFAADWQTSWFATDMEQKFGNYAATEYDQNLPTFNVSLIQPVDQYQLNERAAKYALLFIGLTFVSFFMFEVLKGLRVHPVQYGLVGMGLIIFYVVLLAFTEQFGFATAYLSAATATVLLNTFYLSHILGGKKTGLLFGGLLGLVYGVLYIILNAENIALLMGAILLFVVLAIIMFLTRKLDWYAINQRTPG